LLMSWKISISWTAKLESNYIILKRTQNNMSNLYNFEI
jgi:hypothetical protein